MNRSAAFSLLELIAVMLLMACIMALAAPSMRGFVSGRQSRDTARTMLALLQWARMQAVNEGRAYQLHVDGEARTFYLLAQNGSAFETPGSDFGRRFPLPTGLDAQWIEPAQARVGHLTIQPTGRLDEACVQLTDRDGFARQLRPDTPGGRYVIVDMSQTEEVRP